MTARIVTCTQAAPGFLGEQPDGRTNDRQEHPCLWLSIRGISETKGSGFGLFQNLAIQFWGDNIFSCHFFR
ncbi:hypothetical protein KSB_66580 [Ktedonobacter robiniae]|uniref:Uncharacterized protein n=1 Tax=Ktedonobacter robiniae TaxID=2778365 RepID=A0ABQ3UZG1_9CHLR|nr:hypothetical protein KSB_66580 [Ktedonobacter robiniae]